MADGAAPRNRAERRAAARSNKGSHLDSKIKDITYAQPDRSGPKGKTLLDLANERQAELRGGQPFSTQEAFREEDAEYVGWNDEPFGPGAEAVLWSFSLSMVHLTLDVLANNQYRQEIVWKEIWIRFAQALLMFWVLVYTFHTKTAKKFALLKQILFFAVSISAGCYMFWAGNVKGYFAVMKRAPPLGTLWIWSVIELELVYAVASIAAVGGYIWWNGFDAF